jgi:hypothetical protein
LGLITIHCRTQLITLILVKLRVVYELSLYGSENIGYMDYFCTKILICPKIEFCLALNPRHEFSHLAWICHLQEESLIGSVKWTINAPKYICSHFIPSYYELIQSNLKTCIASSSVLKVDVPIAGPIFNFSSFLFIWKYMKGRSWNCCIPKF